MDTKKCKKCKEDINKKAKKCPKCGVKQGLPTWLIIIAVIVVIGVIASNGGNNSSSNNIPKNVEYIKVSIDELEDTLENNAAAAKETYNGKYLEITGKLGTIDSNLKYISLVSLTNAWDFTGVHCTLKSDSVKNVVKTLSKDQTIIVKGKITEVGEVLGYYLSVDEIIPQ